MLVAIGVISFSFYISHQILLAIFANYTGTKLEGVNQLVAFFATLFLPYLSWKFVELRFLRRHFIINKLLIFAVIIAAVSLHQGHLFLKKIVDSRIDIQYQSRLLKQQEGNLKSVFRQKKIKA